MMDEQQQRMFELERTAAVIVRHAMRQDRDALMRVLFDAAPEIAKPENERLSDLVWGLIFFARRGVLDTAGALSVSDEQVIEGQIRHLTKLIEGLEEPPS